MCFVTYARLNFVPIIGEKNVLHDLGSRTFKQVSIFHRIPPQFLIPFVFRSNDLPPQSIIFPKKYPALFS